MLENKKIKIKTVRGRIGMLESLKGKNMDESRRSSFIGNYVSKNLTLPVISKNYY